MEARDFAIAAHGDQKYGEDPYVRHLDDVVRIVEPYGEEAVTLAYLHDVLEDTAVTYEEIQAAYGDRMAECVRLLSDEPGKNRRERKAATNAKLAKVRHGFNVVLLVKLADRIANVEESKRTNDSRLEMYRREMPEFGAAVYRASDPQELWKRLEDALFGGTA